MLSDLENQRLTAITFVEDYVQLHFDGPYLNAYVWPRIKILNKVIDAETAGYRDALRERIGKLVTRAVERPKEKLAIHFEDGAVLEISLKEEERDIPEAAMLRDVSGKRWNVW